MRYGDERNTGINSKAATQRYSPERPVEAESDVARGVVQGNMQYDSHDWFLLHVSVPFL